MRQYTKITTAAGLAFCLSAMLVTGTAAPSFASDSREAHSQASARMEVQASARTLNSAAPRETFARYLQTSRRDEIAPGDLDLLLSPGPVAPTPAATTTEGAGHVMNGRAKAIARVLAGKRTALKCLVVRGIRPWRAAKRRLVRKGFRRLRVIRFVPRRVTPIAAKPGMATCTGGWYLIKAKKGRRTVRLAINARTLKIDGRRI